MHLLLDFPDNNGFAKWIGKKTPMIRSFLKFMYFS